MFGCNFLFLILFYISGFVDEWVKVEIEVMVFVFKV